MPELGGIKKMPTLREKINETEPGGWSNFLSEFLYRYEHVIHDFKPSCGIGAYLLTNPPQKLRDLAHYLEGLAFKEVALMAEKEAGWVIELQNKMKQREAG